MNKWIEMIRMVKLETRYITRLRIDDKLYLIVKIARDWGAYLT